MNWPALCIGLIVGFYWARVLKLVRKSLKATGRGANFWPTEPLGRALRFIWIPAVVLWIAIPLFIGMTGKTHGILHPIFSSPGIEILSVIVAAIALILTMICWKKMGKSWRMGIDPGERTQLIISGPYAFVRHPIYALSQLMMLASFVAVPNAMMLIIAMIHLLFMQWEARREEHYLVLTHGDAYANYLKHVGRFLPTSTRGFRG